MCSKVYLALLISVIEFSTAYSQKDAKRPFPIIGDSIENHIFTDLVNYPKKQAAINDFKGKWLILDFWGYSCGGCLASFPKMNALHNSFKDRVQVIMVGAIKSRTGAHSVRELEAISKNIYNRLDKLYDLQLPVAFDSVLYLKHDVGSLPHILVIDPQGVIRAKTVRIDSLQLSGLLNGQDVKFEYNYSYSEHSNSENYDMKIPLLTSGAMSNGGPDTGFLYRSLITKSSEDHPFTSAVDLTRDNSRNVKQARVEVFHCDLELLYRLAYFGRIWWDNESYNLYSNWSMKTILETADSANFGDKKRKYSYSLIVPKERSNGNYLMSVMQSDLYHYFGYIATREKRKVPVYTIKVRDTLKVKKLISTGGNPDVSDGEMPYTRLYVRNCPFPDFLSRITSSLDYDEPLLDSTNLNMNFDIDVKANMLDKYSVRSAINELGFSITQGFKEMDVLVIKDKKHDSRAQ